MVFESIVVDVLNRFLGDYVENLNSNQLKLGIWGGDVVLENLILKQNALEELNVPVQTVYGRLGKLQLKIPWKNLYGASVEARVDRLFLIVNPIAEIKYDAEREAKMALESKRAELARIEEAKRKENEKDIKLDETFVEKLVTQIIKNVQLKITDIHIRYEDSVTNPNAPFSFGITLHNLSVHTTDENWKQAVLQQSVTKIFKILNLEGLALYWNPTTELYSKKGSDVITTKLESEIATKSSQPQDYAYALGPINATAKLKLNPKPEGDTPRFSVPKVILDLHMDSLDLKLTKAQYQDMLLLADSMDRMSRGAQYRKYRPDVKTYKGHYKEWWKFAYTCVLENEVRRRRKNWDWEHMMAHRLLCKEYATAYKCKLCSKNKTPPDAEKVIVEAEQKLDLFNLVVIRQRIEMEVEKILQLEAEERKREREQRGWFSWWYGSGGAKDEDNTEGVDFKKQFERAMTPEEKAKLFRAIDYQENSAPTHLPVEYEAVVMHYRLDKLQLTVTDKNLEVLKGIVDFVNLVIIQRPSANAMKVDAQMRAFTVQGVVQGDFLPQLVVSKDVTNDINLLNVTFEINPLDGSCDQRIKVLARPLQMVYDAQTVIEIVNLFKPPRDSSAMATLQVAAGNKLSDFKEMSALGMQYATSQHMYLDIDIDVAASYVIVPKHGIHKGDESCVVVKLGAINVKSEPREQGLDVRAMYDSGLAEEEIMRQLQLRSYDKMTLTLTHMQIVVATEGEDWQEAIASSEATGLHILQPTTLKIQIHKCLIADDPRLPKIKVRGELQKIAFSISEDRLLTLFEILMAMPLPQSETVHQLKMSSDKIAYVVTGEHVEQTVNDFATSESRGSNLSLFKYLDPAEKQKRDSSRSVKLSKLKLDEPAKQMTEVEAFFIMKELVIFINRNTKIYSEEHERFLKFSLYRLEVKAIQKTFTLFANVKLASVNMFHHRTGRKAISMIETPDVDVKNISQSDLPVVSVAEDDEQYLFSVTYYNVDKACPEFRSTYGSVEQKIKLQFTDLKITLHLEALQEILVVVNEYTTRAATLQKSNDRIADAGALDTIHEDEELVVGKAKVSAVGPSRSTKIESIQLKVDANLGTIQIEFATDARRLSLVTFEKAIAGLMVKQSYTQVDCAIGSVKVVDLNPVTIHREILKVLGGDIFNVKIVMYNLEQFPTVSNVNMSIDAQINCLRIVFLNWFVSSMLEFLNNFQTAQEAIIEASSQAADAARANVQSAYEDQSKVSLKVRLDAPIIIVPENSKSMNAVLVDLGWMNINNKFVDLNVEGKKVTVDDLILDLSDMKVVCMQMAEDSTSNATLSGQDEQERQILRPTSFKLYVKRSLSLWCDELPDLDISGRMKSISIQLGNGDYQSIMKILNQNLQEGETSKPTPAASKSSKQTNKKPKPDKKTSGVLKEPSNDTLKSQTVVQTVAQTTQAKKVKTTIKFAFTMDSFVIDVRSTVNIKGSTYTKDVDLARFGLALLSLKGRMYSDGSMNTSILLVDCTLDDTRPARGAKITRYLERRVSDANKDGTKEITKSPDKIRSMIDVTYTMKNSDTFIDIRIFSFNLILAMDFLLKLKDFLTTGLSYEPETKPVVKPAESAQKRHSTVISTRHSVSDTAPVTIEQGAIVEEQQQANPMMTVNIKIEQPDIILVESLEDKECDALVLNMLVRFKLRQTSEHMVADGGISDLQMVVRQLGFNDPSTPRYLLAPTTVSLALAQPPNSGMHVDIAVTDIKITISPEIMNLLNRVLATMTRNEEDDQDKEHKAVYYGMDLWGIQPLQPQEHWFLKTELAEEAINMDEAKDIKKTVVEGEICLLSSPSIVVALEIEIGKETVPVLVLQASLNGQVKDWSSELHLESTWAMQVSYYNISRAVWEPLVEPVEVLKDSQYKHVPWELKLEVLIRATDNNISIDTMDEAANAKAAAIRQARQTLTLSSNETFEVTLTRSALEMLTMLGNSFSTSVDLPDAATSSKSTADENYKKWKGAPYVLHNCTGLTTKLFLEANPDFCVFVTKISPINYKEVLLEPGASVPLQLKKAGMNLIRLNEPPPTLELKVHIVELNETIEIPVERADKRYFTVGRQLTGKVEKNVPHVAAMEPRGLISDVVMQDAALHIYLRSVVQSLCRLDSMEPLWSIWDLMMQDAKVTNFLDVNVSVYYMTLSGNEVRLLDEVAPGAKLRLPLQATHTPTAELFFSVEGFTVSVSPYIWRELQHEQNLSKLLTCESKDKNSGEKFYIRAVGETEQVYYENTNKHTFASSCYNIALKPAVKLQNCLPVAITVSQLGLERTQTFESGEMINLSHLAPYRASIVVMIQSYLDKCWVCTKNLPTEDIELSVWSFDSHDSPSIMTLDLGLHNINTEGTQVISLYCPFWMVNKTGLTLCYRKSKKPERETSSPRKILDNCCYLNRDISPCLPNVDETGNVIFHPKTYKEPILFSFRAKNFFGKKKAALRVEFGDWSDKFSLDVPGSSGVVLCKNEGKTYQVTVTNKLTFNSLTKMVIFSPYFVLINEAPFDIQYQEMHRSGDPWTTVAQNKCEALWPIVENESKLLILRVARSCEITAPFLYTEQHSVCLKLSNQFGGLHVEVQVSEGGTYITVRQYREGHAPALLVNYSPHSVALYEKHNVNIKTLPPMHKMLFTWDNPAGPRFLIFEGDNNHESETDLRQDDIQDFTINSETVYWTSFLDGLQRVILLTDDHILASGAHTIGEAEQLDTEVVLSLQGMGLSLVNDYERVEILYMSVSNSGIIWEQCKLAQGCRNQPRYKKVEGAKLIQLEEAYQKYLNDKAFGESEDVEKSYVYMIDDRTEVNFEEMRQLKPNPRILKRTLNPGLWMSYGMSPHTLCIHARLNRLQIDQQLPLPTFPVILAPLPPPKSIANTGNGVKPFIELSVVERVMEHSKVRQYKYCKMLVQEFQVKIDMELVNAMMAMFPQRTLTEKEALEAFQLDLETARQDLDAMAKIGIATDQKNFYDNLHLSPLKVHLSFSLGGATQLPTFIGTILQSIGVTLTDMNDVVFKLAYYERNYEFLSNNEIMAQVQSHYTGQALKQLYVLVLGLDLLGNPYALVVGLKKGVEDLFYEPFQGAIQGPGEFAEGLFLGVRSLVGHTVGGAAGAVSRITGAMGHGLAALSLDKDYQRRRRDNINKPPANLQEGLARSGKGLVMGVFDGVTGVFTKPIEGAREQGVEGFFKGLGRGAVGLVARPTAGVVDFASGSLDAVKRAADTSEEVTKRRAARYFAPESGVRPYSRLQAEGYRMLSELEKGKFVTTDAYAAHVWVIPGKEAVMCTDKRLLYVERNSVFGGWQIVWSYLWKEIPEVPTAVQKGVYIPTTKKKVFGMFPSTGTGKVIFLYDEQQKRYLLAQCQQLMANAR